MLKAYSIVILNSVPSKKVLPLELQSWLFVWHWVCSTCDCPVWGVGRTSKSFPLIIIYYVFECFCAFHEPALLLLLLVAGDLESNRVRAARLHLHLLDRPRGSGFRARQFLKEKCTHRFLRRYERKLLTEVSASHFTLL